MSSKVIILVLLLSISTQAIFILAILEYWISGTHTLLVRVHEFQSNSSRTYTCPMDKNSGTHTSIGPSTDILWYICDRRVNTCEIVWHSIKKKFQIDLFCFGLNIWYMGCDSKFRNFFKFYHHQKVNWLIWLCLSLLLSFIQVHFPIQLLVNVWKKWLQT